MDHSLFARFVSYDDISIFNSGTLCPIISHFPVHCHYFLDMKKQLGSQNSEDRYFFFLFFIVNNPTITPPRELNHHYGDK